MKKAVVTGSMGNIGKPLVKYLKEHEYEVREIDIKPGYRENYYCADITDPADIMQVFDGFEPDYIFHLAAMVSRVTCEQSGSMCIETNLTGTQNMLTFAKKYHSMFINFSTSEVYGPDIQFMDESETPHPNNRYGLSKLLAESLVEYEVRQHGLRAVSLRPFMMYDENEDLGAHRSAMIRFAEDLYMGKEITVHQGSARGWLHVSDAIRAIEAATRVEDYSVINIGNGEVHTIEELAYAFCEEYEMDHSLIKILPLPERMTLVKNPNLQRQKELLGVVPMVGFREGIHRVANKMKERRKK